MLGNTARVDSVMQTKLLFIDGLSSITEALRMMREDRKSVV